MITVRAGTSLNTGPVITGLDISTFWWQYFALGGSHTLAELFDYLNGDSA